MDLRVTWKGRSRVRIARHGVQSLPPLRTCDPLRGPDHVLTCGGQLIRTTRGHIPLANSIAGPNHRRAPPATPRTLQCHASDGHTSTSTSRSSSRGVCTATEVWLGRRQDTAALRIVTGPERSCLVLPAGSYGRRRCATRCSRALRGSSTSLRDPLESLHERICGLGASCVPQPIADRRVVDATRGAAHLGVQPYARQG